MRAGGRSGVIRGGPLFALTVKRSPCPAPSMGSTSAPDPAKGRPWAVASDIGGDPALVRQVSNPHCG